MKKRTITITIYSPRELWDKFAYWIWRLILFHYRLQCRNLVNDLENDITNHIGEIITEAYNQQGTPHWVGTMNKEIMKKVTSDFELYKKLVYYGPYKD